MSENPPNTRPIAVLVAFESPLDTEAYSVRLGREPGYQAVTDPFAVDAIEVRLSDHSLGQAQTPTPTVLVRRAGTPHPDCPSCWPVAAEAPWSLLLDRIAEAAGRRPPLPVASTDELALLTRRERDVLRLVGLGMSVPECAEALGVAPSTVGNHKYRLMRKLGVTTSLQLLRIAVRNGLVDFEASC